MAMVVVVLVVLLPLVAHVLMLGVCCRRLALRRRKNVELNSAQVVQCAAMRGR